MPTIRQLPPNLVNQIAAGEVIERPASVVKELLENSVDAGARRIELLIEKGGTERIRVSDDGCGISAEQLPLAVTSHATSKLPDDDSLFHVGTLGFRGEALASIASVSQMLIRSRTEAGSEGAELRIRGGVLEPVAPCGCPQGTSIEIRNLFFNTPVRRKFLRTPQTERGHIVEAFTRLALANPQIHMVLSNGDKTLYDLPQTERWVDRIEAFFGGEVSDSLIPLDSDDGQIRISGYACDPAVSRGNNRMQYLFLNGRFIRDRSLQHALGEAYRGLLMVGRFPVGFLRVSIPPEMVDVNVHPCKLEVRFTDGGRIYSRVLQTLRHRFLSTDMTMRVGPSSPAASSDASNGDATNSESTAPLPSGSALGMAPSVEASQRQNVIDWARTGTTAPPIAASLSGVPQFQPFADGPSSVAGSLPAAHSGGLGPGAADAGQPSSDPAAPWEQTMGQPGVLPSADGTHGGDPLSAVGRTDPAHSPPLSHLGLQVHNRYLVTQDEKGMVVVDQHALHERVLYERIREKVLGEGIETQRLLVPEPVSLTPAEQTAALDAKDVLDKVGIEIEPFGGDTVLVQSYPAMLANLSPSEVLRQSLESIIAAGKDPEIRDLLDHLLHTIACKAAIKAGDRLAAEEITSLLEQRDLYQDTHHCPHGRPTALFFSRDELDRMFGRLGPRGRANV
ncbi:DNA mismatch repair endonuclease MutL [Roseimaritima ulvae]|uniref:DNA mismatch repair protein MutL n=1 Tax=Roseimaritima ulvae TaxID=980254 RepID=A0A5B9QLN5_9BACT|nr:DNA mismatch repair endonuclease MutL [Roseimaritima ulvae]QEG38445.1 DNA mismatch repair protein MutL [Roseimaritima ulvae]